ncbi:MAG TPA: glycosyltransferase family 39 protein, partial [Patescibacteria group bacterium]|nr:glycosyltransferase family 39 protein [Patescibacteria group bacterium]
RKKIKLLTKKGNRSIGRNFAIKNTKANIIAITDAGCILDKNWFKNITSPLKKIKVDVVAGYYKAKSNSTFQKSLVPYVLVMPDRVDSKKFLPATRSMAIRKSAWQQVGGFDESLSNNEDYAFANKIQKEGLNIEFTKNAVVYWIPRNNLKQAFVMFYRFAKGDMEANIFRPKVALIIVRYIIAAFLVLFFFNTQSLFILYLLFIIFFLYLYWAVAKNYKYVREPLAIVYLPILQLTSDAAVLLGTLFIFCVKYFAGVSLISFIYLIFKGINLPYVGQNAYNFITYSLIAHNYNQFGYLQTKFAPLVSVSAGYPLIPEYFIHHPPLLSIIESLFLKIFGEGFWVGRFMSILFTAALIFVIYLIDKNLSNKKQASVTLAVLCLLPATIIFGKMVGQEPLVLFFTLSSLYFSIKYVKENKSRNLYFAFISIILGVLSDWPAVYFALFLLPLFIRHKKTKHGLLLLGTSLITAGISVGWIAFIRSGLWDLKNAAGSRLFTALNSIPLWPILWVATTVSRFLIYFSPVFVFLSLVFSFRFVKRFKLLSDRDLVILILGFFGLFHLMLYTEASFTHPYLIIYLVPFIAMSVSTILLGIINNKSYFAFFAIFLFSIIYLFTICSVKEEQIVSNAWRYQLAEAMSPQLSKYETVIYNVNYVIDPDIWRYPLLINPKLQDKNNSSSFLSHYNHYVYSCSPSCDIYGGQINSLKNRYQYVDYKSANGEAYLFYLKKKRDNNKKNKTYYVETSKINDGFFIGFYRKVRDLLKTPQI